jgi:predicted signal transduction protein with EAL and GGDEF domain
VNTLRTILGLAACQLAIAVAIVLTLDDRAPVGDMAIQAVVVVLVGAALAEVLITNIQFRSETYTFSMGEVPFVIGLAFVSPITLVAARCIAITTAAVARKVPAHKAAFNMSVFALESAAAAAVMAHVGGHPGTLTFYATLVAATVTANVVNLVTMANVIRIVRRQAVAAVVATALRMQPVYLSNTFLGVLLVAAASRSWWLVAAGSLPVASLWAAARLSAAVQQKVEQLETVARFTTVLDGADEHHALSTALAHLRELLNVDTVLIQLRAEHDRPPLRVELVNDQAVVTEVSRIDPLKLFAAQLDRAAFANGPAEVRRLLGAERLLPDGPVLDDLLVVPFQHGRARGMVAATDRVGTSPPFAAADVSLGSAIVHHLAAVLQTSALASELDELARHDHATGLFNARGLEAVLEGQPAGEAHAAMVLELLDAHDLVQADGRDAGDRLVAEVARRLRHELGDGAVLARTGTWEFVAVVDDCDRSDVGERVDRLVEVLRRPFDVGGHLVAIAPVVGVATGADAADLAVLTHRATTAAAHGKRVGTTVHLATTGGPSDGRRRLALAAALPDAIDRGEITVLFQPKVDVATRRPIGAEALVRWTHPELGPVSPPEIVELAERGGLIRRLTDHVIAMALRIAGEARAGGHDVSIAVNLSPHDLHDHDLVETVLALVAAAGLPTGALELEVTEGSVMNDPDRAIDLLRRLDDAGVHIAVDDYGTGYSSLTYLRRLPIRQVKIDRSFVMGLGEPSPVGTVFAGDLPALGDEVIVRSTIDLGHNLGLSVVAEGVETEEALDVLRRLGCDIGQGYLFSRPLAAPAFLDWLIAAHHPEPTPTPTPVELRH